MSKYLVVAKIASATDAGGNPVEYRKGAVVELTSAQVSALGASNFRLMNNPGAGTQVTSYGVSGGTLTTGINPGSVTHDTNGEAAGAAN
jgi:hypothetical protein